MTDLRNNTIAQYKMNDNDANSIIVNAVDAANPGTYGWASGIDTNTKTTTGKINKALYFKGSYQDSIKTNQLFLSTYKNSFSFNIWVKPNDGVTVGNEQIASVLGSGGINQYSITQNTNVITVFYKSNGNLVSTSFATGWSNGPVPDFHMLTVVVENLTPGAKISLYYDGDLKDSDTDALVIMGDYANDRDVYLGAENGGAIYEYWGGDMDNFCLFNKALSQEEIDFLYNSGAGTEALYDITGEVTNNNFFATIGDYDTRSTFPNNASKLVFSNIESQYILRTANNDFNHIMVSGVPLSVSSCFYSNETTKFRTDDSRDFPDLTYFYALDVIIVDNVSHQTLTDEERTTQFNDAKLYVNRWNALNYLNTFDASNAVPTNTTPLFGSTLGLGQYGELIFNKTSYTIDNVEEFKEVAFMNNLVSVGRVGNDYYLLITT